MNKNRLEALSDGVFAIVMTLLIIEIKVPHVQGGVSDQVLWQNIYDLWPLFRSYLISFIIIGMYWMAHHAFFHLYMKHANRIIGNLNTLFLMFMAFIPFSAHLLGQHPENLPAVYVYAVNIILIGLTLFLMLYVVISDRELMQEGVSKRLIIQGTIRVLLPPVFAVIGGLVAPLSKGFTFFLFAFPVIFNIIPGTLDGLEKFYKKISKPLRSNPSEERI